MCVCISVFVCLCLSVYVCLCLCRGSILYLFVTITYLTTRMKYKCKQ